MTITITYRLRYKLPVFIGLLSFCVLPFLLRAQSSVQRLPSFTEIKKTIKNRNVKQLLAIEAPDIDFIPVSQSDDTYTTYQEYYKGVPVEMATVRLHSRDEAQLATGIAYDFLSIDLSVVPTLSADEVINVLSVNDSLIYLNEGLVIYINGYTGGKQGVHLTHRTRVHSPDYNTHYTVYIDAHTGEEVDRWQHIHEHTVPMLSLYNDTVQLDMTLSEGHQCFYNYRSTTLDLSGARHLTGIAPSCRHDSADQRAIVQAFFGIESSHDYFKRKHDRDSYDGLGSHVQAFINYRKGYNNAFWNGQDLVLGSGDGYNYGPIVALDIIGHEYTHGLIDHTADLRYVSESGSLNESFADIFGEMIEYNALGSNDWILGKDVALHNRLLFRSMAHPNVAGQPDTYGGRYWIDPICGSPSRANDRCGVHINSGVQNKWFYILSVGESGLNDNDQYYDVEGIGREKAAAIAYQSLKKYLSPLANYQDARRGSIYAAIDLYGEGSGEHQMTTNAWHAVGVGEPYQLQSAMAEIDTILLDTLLSVAIELAIVIDSLTHSAVAISWNSIREAENYTVSMLGVKEQITRDSFISFSDLKPGTVYNVSIAAWDTLGHLLASDTSTFVTDEWVDKSDVYCDDRLYTFERDGEGWRLSQTAKWQQEKNGSRGLLQLKGGRASGEALSPTMYTTSKSVVVSLDIYTWSMELNDEITIEYWDGDWKPLATLSTRKELKNRKITSHEWQINLSYNQLRLRIKQQANSLSDHIYIDRVEVKSKCALPLTFAASTFATSTIYPNPSDGGSILTTAYPPTAIRVFSSAGQLIYKNFSPKSNRVALSLNRPKGVYWVQIVYEDRVELLPMVLL